MIRVRSHAWKPSMFASGGNLAFVLIVLTSLNIKRHGLGFRASQEGLILAFKYELELREVEVSNPYINY